ncbi:MAG: hypothetical protein QXX36_03585 [Candidatus Rehaiarchaeum fermentans]|nr:hypothetical protein [Candidatus Rehaiarchaeum fermentans]
MIMLQKKLAKRETTEKVNEATISSIVNFMKIFKDALGIKDDFLPLTEDERIVEFGQNVKIGVAYIKINLNDDNYHFVIFIYSGQTSKPITPSDVKRELRTAFKWLNKVTMIPYMARKTETFILIVDRITLNAEKLLKKEFNNKFLVLRLRRNEKPIQDIGEIKNRLENFLQRIAKTINTFIRERTEKLIYRLKDNNVKTYEKVAPGTKVLIDRMYSIYKALAKKYKLEDELKGLVYDFYSPGLSDAFGGEEVVREEVVR